MASRTLLESARAALAGVDDPELHKPLIDLGMIRDLRESDGLISLTVMLTISGCPMRDRIEADIQRALLEVQGADRVDITFEVMSADELSALKKNLRGGIERVNPFASPQSLTRVIGIASGKGGVGKSSVTANLAVSAAQVGYSVGILDADVYGHSIPRLLGIIDQRPTTIDKTMYLPVEKYGVKVVSMEMFKPDRADHIAYRGPLLHRVLEQLMSDAYWGSLDFLFLDLPPGTGDIAISLGQLLPNSEIIVVTTPQLAAAEVAERAGRIAHQMGQSILGVVENMAESPCPHCGEPIALFGGGGGAETALRLSQLIDKEIKVLAKIPFDLRVRNGGDDGFPVVVQETDTPTVKAFSELLANISKRPRSIVGKPLTIS